MKLEKLKPGMTVYDVGKRKMGNTTLRTVMVWPVKIHEVDLQKREVIASWNCNPSRTFSERAAGKWKKDPPLLVTHMSGASRLATKAERDA